MGTLSGHLLPGSFFLLVGLRWCYCILLRYDSSRKETSCSERGPSKHASRYKSTLMFPFSCCRFIPLEAILVVAFSVIGFLGELATGFTNGKFTELNNIQHMTMYSFFGMMGIVVILQHYRFALPPDLDYVTALLALLMEGLLFIYHLHGRSHMDIQLHVFLVYLVGGCIVSGMLEMHDRSNVMPALCRAFFVVTKGSWFIQVGFVLYPPSWMGSWDQENHDQMMIITMMYTWHFAGTFILFSIFWAVINMKTKYMSRAAVYQALGTSRSGLQGDNSNNGGAINLNSNNKLDAEQSRIIITDSEEEEVL